MRAEDTFQVRVATAATIMAAHEATPEEQWEEKMKTLTLSVIKSGKLKTRRRVGKRIRKRDKYFLNKVIGEWEANSVFIDNQKLIVQPLEHHESGAQRVEIMLSSIKHVVPEEDGCEFALTWTATETASAFSPARVKVREMMEDEDEFMMGLDIDEEEEEEEEPAMRKDRVLVFRAADEDDAREWLNALNRAIQVSASMQATASSEVLRGYSTMPQERLGESLLASRSIKRKVRGQLAQSERLWDLANKEAKKLPPGVQAAGRKVGAVASTLSTMMVGGFFKSLLKAGVAPSWVRRRVADAFQAVWLDAIAWMAPPMLFHVTGDVPTAARPKTSWRKLTRRASKRRSSRKRAPPVRIVIMNSACECDLVFTMLLAKAIDESHGSVKALLSGEERSQLLGLGAVYDLFGFVFLNRKSAEERQALDRKRVARHLEALTADGAYEWVVIFPERGWPTRAGLRAQDEAEENVGRPSLDQLLLPDANELEACLDALSGHRNVQIFDFTVAYQGYSGDLPRSSKDLARDAKVPTYRNLLNGTASNGVHIDSKLFTPDDVLDADGGVQGWLDARWERKDELLRHFATYQVFPPDADAQGKIRQDAFSIEGSLLLMLAIWLFNLVTFSFVFVYLI